MIQLEKSKVENQIATKIIDAAFEVYTELGPGLLESVYSYCLARELKLLGLKVQSELELPIHYKDEKLKQFYKVDLLVNERVIIELKATETFHEVHYAQLLTYLKLSKIKLGILINFNTAYLKSGVKRVVNGL